MIGTKVASIVADVPVFAEADAPGIGAFGSKIGARANLAFVARSAGGWPTVQGSVIASW